MFIIFDANQMMLEKAVVMFCFVYFLVSGYKTLTKIKIGKQFTNFCYYRYNKDIIVISGLKMMIV